MKEFDRLKQKMDEDEQIEKINSAKAGVPITLSGYAIFDPDGNDTGKRFIRKEDAEKYLNDYDKTKKIDKTFAQKLNEHNEFLEKTIKQCDKLFSLAEEAEKNGDYNENERLNKQVEELLHSATNSTQEFGIKHEKELGLLSKLTPPKSGPEKENWLKWLLITIPALIVVCIISYALQWVLWRWIWLAIPVWIFFYFIRLKYGINDDLSVLHKINKYIDRNKFKKWLNENKRGD